MYFDTHCHLNDEEIYPRIDEVINDAKKTGVNKFLVVGYDKKSSLLAIKIAHDYEVIKNSLLKELHLDYPPISVFGLEELQHLLHHEEELTSESEVIAAASATQGFEVLRLKPSYARKHHFPLYVPAPSVKKPSANDYALAAAKVLKSGLNSPLLLNFKDHMSAPGAEIPTLL